MGERAALRSFVVAKCWSKSEGDVHLARNLPNALKSVSALRWAVRYFTTITDYSEKVSAACSCHIE